MSLFEWVLAGLAIWVGFAAAPIIVALVVMAFVFCLYLVLLAGNLIADLLEWALRRRKR